MKSEVVGEGTVWKSSSSVPPHQTAGRLQRYNFLQLRDPLTCSFLVFPSFALDLTLAVEQAEKSSTVFNRQTYLSNLDPKKTTNSLLYFSLFYNFVTLLFICNSSTLVKFSLNVCGIAGSKNKKLSEKVCLMKST